MTRVAGLPRACKQPRESGRPCHRQLYLVRSHGDWVLPVERARSFEVALRGETSTVTWQPTPLGLCLRRLFVQCRPWLFMMASAELYAPRSSSRWPHSWPRCGAHLASASRARWPSRYAPGRWSRCYLRLCLRWAPRPCAHGASLVFALGSPPMRAHTHGQKRTRTRARPQ